MQTLEERRILEAVSTSTSDAWPIFLDRYADHLFRLTSLFCASHDERMELFLLICSRLKEDGMRRVRAYRYRPDAPCRLSTYLSVVARNIAIDYRRARLGRLRLFRAIEGLEEADRLVFLYHIAGGRDLEETRRLLQGRHGLRLSIGEAEAKAARMRARLTPAQRWSTLCRLYARRDPLAVDRVKDVVSSGLESEPLVSREADPEARLRRLESARLLRGIAAKLPPRHRLALTLAFRDGMSAREAARVMRVTARQARNLIGAALATLQQGMRDQGIVLPDVEVGCLAAVWSG